MKMGVDLAFGGEGGGEGVVCTHVKWVDLAVELVNTAALHGIPPLLAVPPHREGLVEIEVARSEETAAERRR